MSEPPPNIRVYFNPPPHWRAMGCIGCAAMLFIVGGILGVLLFGWEKLLGM